nr:hypothetical protein [Tanacetum cinerariifolium]
KIDRPYQRALATATTRNLDINRIDSIRSEAGKRNRRAGARDGNGGARAHARRCVQYCVRGGIGWPGERYRGTRGRDIRNRKASWNRAGRLGVCRQ